MDSILYARFFWPEITSPNGQKHRPTIDVNKDGTCTYFGKEPNALMYSIIKETKEAGKAPDAIVGIVQRLSGKLPMYANTDWLLDSIGGTPESVMNFILTAQGNDASLYSIKHGMKILLESLLEADDKAPVEHFKSFVSAHLETYCK